MLKLFGITYGDKTTEYTEYRSVHNGKPWRFEYNSILQILDDYKAWPIDHIGIFSWKFKQKTGVSRRSIEAAYLKNSDYEILNLSPNLGKNIGGCGNFMDWSEAGHKGIKDFIKSCCKHTGMLYENDPQHIIYANQFIASKEVYYDYVERIIKPCLELLEGELWEQVNKPAGYTAGLEKEELKKRTGLEFYNYLPFILERMMSQYIQNFGIRTVDLL